MDSDYQKAQKLGRTQIDRWGDGIPHHPMPERLMRFLTDHDFNDYDDHFCWKVGGDGDNGETLMYQMDAFFETLDMEEVSRGRTEAMSFLWWVRPRRHHSHMGD